MLKTFEVRHVTQQHMPLPSSKLVLDDAVQAPSGHDETTLPSRDLELRYLIDSEGESGNGKGITPSSIPARMHPGRVFRDIGWRPPESYQARTIRY